MQSAKTTAYQLDVKLQMPLLVDFDAYMPMSRCFPEQAKALQWDKYMDPFR